MYKVQGPSDQLFIFVDENQGHDHLHHGDRDRGRGEVGQCHVRSEPLLVPIIGATLRYLSKWEICSDLAPILSDLAKHKGYLVSVKALCQSQGYCKGRGMGGDNMLF